MSKFTKFQSIRPIPKSNKWITTWLLIFYENEDLTWTKYIVSEGFIFNWMSVPRLLWIFFPPIEAKTLNASCLHDFLFQQQVWFLKSNCLFYKALRASWNSIFKSLLFYIWVTNPIWYYIYLKK